MIDAAVIGLGRWGKNIVEAAQGKSKYLRFIRGVSKEPELARDFAAAKGFELSTDFDQAVADPRVQAVFLATPHSLHVGQISTVAAAGKPVWCEKPLALTRAEAERAIAATQKAGVHFALGNNKRCFPSMRELKRVVADGVIGDVLHIEGNFTNEHSTRVKGGWRDDPRESPGGGMTGAGLHVLDFSSTSLGRSPKLTHVSTRKNRHPIRATWRRQWCSSQRVPPVCLLRSAPHRCIGGSWFSEPKVGRKRARKQR